MYNRFMNPAEQNPFIRARQRNLLTPPSPTPMPHQRFATPLYEPDQEPESDTDRYFNEMQRIQGAGSPALTAYKQALAQQPTREQYAPGLGKRLLTALAGGAITYGGGNGYDMAREVQDRPYNRAVESYGTRLKGLGEQADIEQGTVDSQLKMLQNARAMGLKYDEFKLKQLESQNRMQNDTITARAAQTRAQAYAENMQKPGYDSIPQQDGSVLYVNQRNPADTITVPAKTVAAGQLGVARQNAQTNVRRANTYDRSVTEDARHNGVMETRPTGGTPSPNAQQDAEDMALDELAMDPDFADFVKEEGGSGFGPWKKPGYRTVAPDNGSEEYKVFLDALNAKTAEILSGRRQRTRSMGR
jgi:hypothetical protein